ncbi:putative B3 domain-containing protein REM15 isoform X7 [Nicotiana tomentosiformis]|uniref:putative B3 domain-containing protein REM15 isoform X7 n=1 Tax=Nicotiana tomentosiformis TaxID=4098 RepID=UPI00388C3F51
MKVRPVKPQFFKPILPGFKHALKIPKGFLKYLKGHEHEHAVLRKVDKYWLVKVNDYRFKAGWAEFVEENDLQLGDMLVFRYEGNMEFEVMIFDSSHCNREYAEYLQEEEAAATHTFGEASKNFEFEDTNNYASIPSGDRLYQSSPSTSCYLSHSRNTDDVIEIPSPGIKLSDEDSSRAEAATDKHVGHSHFVCTIKPYCLTYGYMYLPQQFANGLSNKKCDLIIRDERQRLWNLKLSSDCNNRVRIGDGWRKFIVDNRLKEGDHIVFEVVTDEETSIWKFHVVTTAETPMRKFQGGHGFEAWKQPLAEIPSPDDVIEIPSPCIKSSDEDFSHAEAATDKHVGHSHFVCTIKPYCLTYGYLYLAQQFANGLSNKKCDLIIRDERQRLWNLKLSSDYKNRVRIGDGWCKFIADNRLKEGDRIVFEVVTDEETSIWKFHAVTNAETPMRKFQANATEKPEPNIMSSYKAFPDVEAAKDMPLSRPDHFISTVKLHHISKCRMHVPKLFARENGLSNRKCTIAIRDSEQRSLEFRLYSSSAGSTFIGGEWRKFCAANFLKEGDRIMFEIFAKGEKPILKFYDLRANASLHPEETKPNLDAERVSTQEKPKSNIISSREAVPNVEAAKDMHLGHPHFICTMKPYYLSKHFLRVPSPFARQHGLRDRKCTIMIRDEQRSWTFTLYSCGTVTYIGGGWRDFCIANCLKEGDRVMFGIVANGEKPILKFHDLRENALLRPEGKKTNSDTERVSTQEKPKSNVISSREAVPNVEAAKDMHLGHPHFICTMKPYYLSKRFLRQEMYNNDKRRAKVMDIYAIFMWKIHLHWRWMA